MLALCDSTFFCDQIGVFLKLEPVLLGFQHGLPIFDADDNGGNGDGGDERRGRRRTSPADLPLGDTAAKILALQQEETASLQAAQELESAVRTRLFCGAVCSSNTASCQDRF